VLDLMVPLLSQLEDLRNGRLYFAREPRMPESTL
jgi:hypothetical protein